MPKKKGIVFVLVGTVLILSALSLFLYNRYEDAQAGQKAESLLADVQAVIKDNRPAKPTEIAGYGFVGYISIPDLELELPVMSEYDYERLKIAPCRQFGSSRTDDLVIAAHNYQNHFGRLKDLKKGDAVTFTDMGGIENTYEVAIVDTLAPTEVELVQNSGHDLVLYTCTYGGSMRVTIFCDRLEEQFTPPLPDAIQKTEMD
jgi:sortase A